MVRVVRSVSEFVASVALKAAGADGPLWFRGTSRRSHRLQPSLYRERPIGHAGDVDIASLMTLEGDLIARFRERAQPYLPQALPDADLQLLVIMQHYGLPTRYLDWSESALVGLWFALEATKVSRARVWILDPTAWNRAALSHNGFERGVLSMDDTRLEGHTPTAVLDRMATYPLAIWGAYNNERIVGQKGAFTIAGKSLDPMDGLAGRLAAERQIDSTRLVDAIDIPADAVQSMYKELTGLGYGRSAIYPDLQNLALELKSIHCEVKK